MKRKRKACRRELLAVAVKERRKVFRDSALQAGGLLMMRKYIAATLSIAVTIGPASALDVGVSGKVGGVGVSAGASVGSNGVSAGVGAGVGGIGGVSGGASAGSGGRQR